MYCRVANKYKKTPVDEKYIFDYFKEFNKSTAFSYTIYTDADSYQGKWLFMYIGIWEQDGKSGWKPVRQTTDE